MADDSLRLISKFYTDTPTLSDDDTMETAEPEKKDMKDEKKDSDIDTDEPKCLNCRAIIPDKEDKACRKCGYYRPHEGESFDVSKVFWRPPQCVISKLPIIRSVDTPHDLPFPGGFGGGEEINTPECNEWILNHLPISEEQKKNFISGLVKETTKTNREFKIKEDKQKLVTDSWDRRKVGGVKHKTKGRNYDTLKGVTRNHLRRIPPLSIGAK